MSTVELRDLTDVSLGSCDWGACDDESVAERRDPTSGVWLAVCERHTGRRERRASPGRGPCSGPCGREYSLSVDGLVRAHGHGWDRCVGSGRAPRTGDAR